MAEAPPGLRYTAAFMLLAFLPGWTWLRLFFNPSSDQGEHETSPLPDLPERLTLAVGFSLALTIFSAMFAVYLPGPLDLWRLLFVANFIIIAGLAIGWWQQRSPAPPLPRSPAQFLSYPLLILMALLIFAAVLRLPRLGYAEFHEDEAEALLLGVRLMQGEDYALFLHRKGPAQMLVPLAFWLLTGQITEAMARLPFALSSLLSVATLFFIGRRWFGWQAGALAALFWAVNGYAIAFGRMVQYQALIFFLGPLALYCLYLAGVEDWKTGRLEVWKAGSLEGWRACPERSRRVGRWLILGALLLAACLLAHFDALLLLPAAGYLGWVAVKRGGEKSAAPLPPRSLRPSAHPKGCVPLLLALALFIALLAAFYIPYILDPEFQNTANYLTESRVKPGLLYNNLDLLRRLDSDYSSRFYLPLLALGLLGFIIWPGLTRQKWFSALATPEARTAWLMFGAGFVGYGFLVNDPRTHLYIMYPGAVLLAGAGWVGGLEGWKVGRLEGSFFRFSNLPVLSLLVVGGLVLTAIVLYEAIIFLLPESTLGHVRQRWDGSNWAAVYHELPKEREYFGYPKREGWKAIGALRAQGLFPGDFRSISEDFVIPIWYNYGQARSCYDTPQQFFARTPGYDFYIPEQNIAAYHETGWIEREGEIRLRVFSAERRGDSAPLLYTLETLEPAFDSLATPQHFIRQAEPSQPVMTQFGSAIQFLGYDLPATTVAPGETLYVNLYWRALQPPGDNYRAFVHLTDGATLWGQQDDNPACRLPTSIWRTGQRGLGQFRLPVKAETPSGRYPLIIGLYQADTLERLKITAGAGKIGDDFLWLGDIEIR